MTAKTIEVVDEITAHEGLNGAIDVSQIDALLQNLIAINFNKFLGDSRKESGVDAANFGTFPRGLKKSVEIFCKELNVGAGTILKQECKSSGCTDSRNGRWSKTEHNRLWNLAEFAVQVGLQ